MDEPASITATPPADEVTSAAGPAGLFSDLHPPLSHDEALVEANRCYFCFDAPCLHACPTGIDIPGFIRRIATGNLKGAAVRILEENSFGGSCARVCPTEILCEQACVRRAQEERPVKIGLLQRHATDWLMDRQIQPFQRAPASGKCVAVVGAGPAGLACAHRLARHGHDVTVFEARAKPGGLNEYGIAAYKLVDDFAQREVAFLLALGGIRIEYGRALGADLTLGALRRDFDAVFLGLGLAGVNGLSCAPEAPLVGLRDAVGFIAELRQAPEPRHLMPGRRVIVIGGGNTAIDAAVQSRRLGAEDVTIAYRRGPAEMGATRWEQDFARTEGVRILHHLTPVGLVAAGGAVAGVEFAHGRPDTAQPASERVTLPADRVLIATGQRLDLPVLDVTPRIVAGRIVVDANCETSLPGVFAGGDCVAGQDLTVRAVQDGKVAAEAIHRRLADLRE